MWDFRKKRRSFCGCLYDNSPIILVYSRCPYFFANFHRECCKDPFAQSLLSTSQFTVGSSDCPAVRAQWKEVCGFSALTFHLPGTAQLQWGTQHRYSVFRLNVAWWPKGSLLPSLFLLRLARDQKVPLSEQVFCATYLEVRVTYKCLHNCSCNPIIRPLSVGL